MDGYIDKEMDRSLWEMDRHQIARQIYIDKDSKQVDRSIEITLDNAYVQCICKLMDK